MLRRRNIVAVGVMLSECGVDWVLVVASIGDWEWLAVAHSLEAGV